MRRVPLFPGGPEVGQLGLGGLFTSSLAGGVGGTRELLAAAADLGVDLIDTAPAYADSEETLGRALRDVPAEFVVCTKLGGRPQPFDPRDGAALRGSFEESRRLIGRDVAVLYVHEPDRPLQYPWWTSYDPLAGPALDLLNDVKSSGEVRAVGVAGTTVTELGWLCRTGLFDVVLTAFNSNVLFREADRRLIPDAKAAGMGVVVASIFGQGGLGRMRRAEVEEGAVWLSDDRAAQLLALYDLCDDAGLSLPELCVRHSVHTHDGPVLIGPKTVDQLTRSVEWAAAGALPTDVAARLDEVAAMLPRRPYEEPMILPLGQPYFGPGPANVAAATPVGQE